MTNDGTGHFIPRPPARHVHRMPGGRLRRLRGRMTVGVGGSSLPACRFNDTEESRLIFRTGATSLDGVPGRSMVDESAAEFGKRRR